MKEIFDVNKLEYYISSNIFDGSVTPRRTVEYFEIELYTTSGNSSVVNDKTIAQKKGNVLIAVPGDVRYSIGAFECFCVHFSCTDSEISSLLSGISGVFPLRDTETVRSLFEDMITADSMPKTERQLVTQGKLLELVGCLTHEKSGIYTGAYSAYTSDIAAVCEYVRNNPDEHITLSTLASQINLSPGFFHSVFKSVKGITPSEYIIRTRIRHAKKLLVTSGMSLSDIAVVCGFGSQGYFNYVFKQRTGTTPKHYRDEKRIII